MSCFNNKKIFISLIRDAEESSMEAWNGNLKARVPSTKLPSNVAFFIKEIPIQNSALSKWRLLIQ
jgi:hypothetical protein